jgi:hypothetical protein
MLAFVLSLLVSFVSVPAALLLFSAMFAGFRVVTPYLSAQRLNERVQLFSQSTSEFVQHCKQLDSVIQQTLQQIHDVELVSRGYRL